VATLSIVKKKEKFLYLLIVTFCLIVNKILYIVIYRTSMLSAALYGCKTWSLTLREERRLRVFEKSVLRKIFWLKRDEVFTFVVPCIFNHSNKTTNQLQQSIVKFIALSYRYCSTCFGHYSAHHQEPVKLPSQPLVFV
jgi:hypothetical protein